MGAVRKERGVARAPGFLQALIRQIVAGGGYGKFFLPPGLQDHGPGYFWGIPGELEVYPSFLPRWLSLYLPVLLYPRSGTAERDQQTRFCIRAIAGRIRVGRDHRFPGFACGCRCQEYPPPELWSPDAPAAGIRFFYGVLVRAPVDSYFV